MVTRICHLIIWEERCLIKCWPYHLALLLPVRKIRTWIEITRATQTVWDEAQMCIEGLERPEGHASVTSAIRVQIW